MANYPITIRPEFILAAPSWIEDDPAIKSDICELIQDELDGRDPVEGSHSGEIGLSIGGDFHLLRWVLECPKAPRATPILSLAPALH